MRFGTLILALAGTLATLWAAPVAASPVVLARLSPNIPSRTTLTARQGVVIPVCAEVNLNVDIEQSLRDLVTAVGGGAILEAARNLLIGTLDTAQLLDLQLGNLCLCAVGNVLTPESLARIDTSLTSSSTDGQLLGLVALLGSNLLDIVEPLALGALVNDPNAAPVCTYPPNSVPTAPQDQECGSTCPFTCSPGFIRCSDLCYEATVCPTGTVPQRKRTVQERSRFACRQPLSACPVSHFVAGSVAAFGGGFECVDTTSNIESCGGCIVPFKGNVAGQDCTSLPNVADVACESGRCVVSSCLAGFQTTADASACEAKSRFSTARLQVQGKRQARRS